MKRIIMAGALAAAIVPLMAVGAAGAATTLPPGPGAATAAAVLTASSTPAISCPANTICVFTGNGNPNPVPLVGNPSPDPPEIYTADGMIMVGHGTVPNAFGKAFEGWIWSPKGMRLTWANLNNTVTVIQNVAGYFAGLGNYVKSPENGYAAKCLTYQDGGTSTSHWLYLNAKYYWVDAGKNGAGCPQNQNTAGLP